MMRHCLPGWFLLAAISASSAFSPNSPMNAAPSKIQFLGFGMSRGSLSRRPQSVAPTMLVGAKEANEAIQVGLRKMASLPMVASPPTMGVPTQSWKTSNRAQASTLGEELEPRTETLRPQGTISTGNRPPTMDERFNAFKTEFWPWIVVGLIGGGISVTAGTSIPVMAIAAVEAMFWVYCKIQHMTFDRVNEPEELKRDLVELWRMCLTNVPDPRKFLEGWFYDRPFEDIARDDVKEFLAWALFSTTFPNLAAKDVRSLFKVFKLVEEHCDVRFPRREKGAEPLPSMRFSIEPVEYHHKPLLFYASTSLLLGGLGKINLMDAGFSRYNAGALNYWIRMPDTPEGRSKLPIVFVHGVGVGLVTYMSFVRRLIEYDCPVMCVELPFVSMSIDSKVPSIDQQLDSVRRMLNTWGFESATFVGHSYGSILLSWMVQHAPDRVASVCFIDPVVIMLNLKSTLYNFLYKHAAEDGKISDLVGSELFLNHALRRHFWWYRNIIWAQDMHREGIPSSVIVSEKDEIVPSAEVALHIERFNDEMNGDSLVSYYMIKNGTHGDMLFDDSVQEEVLSVLTANWEEANEAHVVGELQMLKKIRSSPLTRWLKDSKLGILKNKVQSRLAGQLYKQSTQVGMQLMVGARWQTRTLTRQTRPVTDPVASGLQGFLQAFKARTVG